MPDGVGAKLREARNQRGIELAEVEAATKIQARFLQALEDEEWDLLPGAFYARSFLRAYAAHLGLDPARLAEEYERARGPIGPPEPSPIEFLPSRRTGSPYRRRLSPRLLTGVALLALGAALVTIGLLTLSGGITRSPAPARQGDSTRPGAGASSKQPPAPKPGTTLTLTATAEVWVCLLGADGRALIDGQILSAGTKEGPFRSARFTISLGNGEVEMKIAGQAADTAQTPNPIGYSIDGGGELRQLPAAERPTCS
jgi:cytoskeleton protein RodZ